MNPYGSPEPPRQPSYEPWTPVRVMVNTLAVLFVLGLVWLLIQVRSIILLLILGILLAAAIEPLVFRLRRRGFSRGQAILTIYAGIVAILGLGLYLVVPPIITQSRELWGNIPDYIDDLRTRAAASDNSFISTVGVRTVNRLNRLYIDVQTNPPIEPNQAIGLATSAVGVVFTTISVMIVAFYWMTEKAIIKRVILGLFPLDRRDRAHAMWDEIEGKLGGWTRGQLLLMLIIGVISTIAYFLLDLPFWFLLGIWAGVTELIPFIGPILGGAAAALVALTVSWEKALIVVVFVLVLQQVESSVIVPRVMRNAVGLTPLSVILAVLIGGALLGALGAVLAIPVAAAVQVLVQELLKARAEAVDTAAFGPTLAPTAPGRPEPAPTDRGAAGTPGAGPDPNDAEEAPSPAHSAATRPTDGVH
jgi:predicted PurR-regulated permease PerM